MHRLIVRPDFDGLVCAVFLPEIFPVSEILFAEPKDIQDGAFPVFSTDIVANLPYHPACAWWFDHHASNDIPDDFRGLFEIAPSAAGLIYHAYLPLVHSLRKYEHLTTETDRIDGALLSIHDVLNPKGYVLLSFTIEPSRDDKDHQYWRHVINLLKHKTEMECLADPLVSDRVTQFQEGQAANRKAIRKHSFLHGELLVTDFTAMAGQRWINNRFLPFAVYPQASIQLQLTRDQKSPDEIKVSLGKSIFRRNSSVHVGRLLKQFGGGGHEGAGSTRVHQSELETVKKALIDALHIKE